MIPTGRRIGSNQIDSIEMTIYRFANDGGNIRLQFNRARATLTDPPVIAEPFAETRDQVRQRLRNNDPETHPEAANESITGSPIPR